MLRHPFLGEAAVQPAAPQMTPYEEPGDYVFTRTLAANEHFADLSQFIDKDSDFIWLATAAKSTGNFSVQFRNPGNRALSSSEEQADNCLGTGQFPVPWLTPIAYPAGGRIGLSITNLTANSNAIEIVFKGIRRYRTQ